MKIKIIYLIIILLFLGSCKNDFLETTPYSGKVIGNFYKTSKDGLEALVAAYDPIRWNYANHIILISEIASDNCFGGAGYADDDRLSVWDNFDGTLYPNPHDEPWTKGYTGVYRVNVFLENAGKIEWGKDIDLKDKYIAEARFLRAFYYFDLVRLWGNIPLLTSVLDVNNLKVPQANPDDVYKLMASDLIFAYEHLPSIPYQKIDPNTFGHVTKWAAGAMLARVFLYYTGYYEKSEILVDKGTFMNDANKSALSKRDVSTYLEEIINNSGHDLVGNFANLWVQAGDKFIGEDNIETVFGIKYTYLAYGDGTMSSWGNNWEVMVCPRNKGYKTYASGWGAAPVNPRLWYEWPEGDTRRNASIISWKDESIDYNSSDVKEYTGFNWKKFIPLAVNGASVTTSLGSNFMTDNPDDKPEIRFADVLLMASEIALSDGDASKAQTYFDRVRDRAFQDNAHHVPVTKAAIMDERKWEFAFEGQRYWDLLRQGLDVAKAAIDWNKSDPYYDKVWFNPKYPANVELIKDVDFRKETKGLFGIPQTQINLSNGMLFQNPGWE